MAWKEDGKHRVNELKRDNNMLNTLFGQRHLPLTDFLEIRPDNINVIINENHVKTVI